MKALQAIVHRRLAPRHVAINPPEFWYVTVSSLLSID
jgi:hypothetical protein